MQANHCLVHIGACEEKSNPFSAANEGKTREWRGGGRGSILEASQSVRPIRTSGQAKHLNPKLLNAMQASARQTNCTHLLVHPLDGHLTVEQASGRPCTVRPGTDSPPLVLKVVDGQLADETAEVASAWVSSNHNLHQQW